MELMVNSFQGRDIQELCCQCFRSGWSETEIFLEAMTNTSKLTLVGMDRDYFWDSVKIVSWTEIGFY